MPIPVRRIIRDLNLAIHVAIHTAECIIVAALHTWRRRHEGTPPVALRRELAKIIRYYTAVAIDGRDFFPVDGDHHGRRPSQLSAQVRRQRREFADRRRRYVTVLLGALGDTPDAVQAALTRHWQIAREVSGYGMLAEGYLASRLAHHDPHALPYVDVYAWVCDVGGTWIATPRAVRRYLRRAYPYERMLDTAGAHQPRRGVRVVPDSGHDQLLVAATTR